MDPSSFSEAFLLSMNAPSGHALAFSTLYLVDESSWSFLLWQAVLVDLVKVGHFAWSSLELKAAGQKNNNTSA